MIFSVDIYTHLEYLVYIMSDDTQATVTVRMSGWLRDELERLAEADHRALSNYLRIVLSQHVESAKAKEAQEANAA